MNSEIMEARRQYNNIFKVFKEKNCPSRNLYLVKISFMKESNIKTLTNEKVIAFVFTNLF